MERAIPEKGASRRLMYLSEELTYAEYHSLMMLLLLYFQPAFNSNAVSYQSISVNLSRDVSEH